MARSACWVICLPVEVPDSDASWSVYVLRCGDGSLYTGIATDVARRLQQHRDGPRGAKYLRGRGPLEVVVQQVVGNRSMASKVEYRLKQLDRTQKLAVCQRKRFKQFVAELVAELDAA